MSNPLWQVLADVDAAGHEVNDCVRLVALDGYEDPAEHEARLEWVWK